MTRRYVSIQQRHKVELGRSNYLLRVINYFRDSIPAVRYASFLIIVAVSGVTTREKKKLDEPTHPILLVYFFLLLPLPATPFPLLDRNGRPTETTWTWRHARQIREN